MSDYRAEIDQHFVAKITVLQVSRTQGTHPKRDKATITNLAISSTDLDKLKEKISAHIALIEAGGDIDERVTRGD